ncbi:MAG: acyl carrier protein [Clostridia bacterium]|nr:acyl carrier protein [Clostridia bacterium]
MEELLEILEEIEAGVDYENCETLIDDGYLDSLSIISLVAEIEERFDVQIPTVEIVPDNFNSAKALWDLIVRLQEEG